MGGNLIDFRWQISEGGYVFEKAGWDRRLRPVGSVVTEYRPLAEFPAMFGEFARTEVSEGGAAGFASRFGCLHDPLRPERAEAEGESLADWLGEIRLMGDAVSLWKLCEAGDKAALARVIRWEDGADGRPESVWYEGRVEPVPNGFLWPRGRTLISSYSSYEDWLGHFRNGELIRPAQVALQRMINGQLEGAVSPRMLWDESRKRPGFHFQPHDLLASMWVQFAHVVAGTKNYRECAGCGRYFEVALGEARADRLTCSVPAVPRSSGAGRSGRKN